MIELKTEESPLDALKRLTKDWSVINYSYYSDGVSGDDVVTITLNGHIVTEEYRLELQEVLDKLQCIWYITEEFNY